MKKRLALLLALAACKTGEVPVETETGVTTAPTTAKQPVSDTYHGVTVTEDYRWLESWDDPAVKKWSAEQNAFARSHLDGIEVRDVVKTELEKILKTETASYYAASVVGGRVFAIVRRPPKQQPFLAVLPSLDDTSNPDILVDPNVSDAKGTTSIDWYVPSPDGKLVAVSISKGGTESGDVTIFDVVTKKPVHETIERVQGGTAGGDLAWTPDGKAFFYTRYPRKGEKPEEDLGFYQQLYFHRLGDDPSKDTYVLGKDLPKIAEIRVAMHGPTERLLVTVQKGDGGEFEIYLREKDGKIRKFSEFGDKILGASFGPKDQLYLLSRQGAPRGKIVRIDIASLDVGKAEVVVPESEATVVESFWGPPNPLVTDSRIYVEYQLGGPSTIRAFDHGGKAIDGPDVPDVSSVSSMTSVGGEAILYTQGGFTTPRAIFHYDGTTTKKTALASKPVVDLSKVTVVREMAKSKDGTMVPVNILLPPGVKKDGNNPTVVYGYGGYGVNITPRLRTWIAPLLDRGVIWAVANIRGGGEFGENWHRQGNLTNKQNVFDDFTAVVQHLIAEKYTSSERVATLGGSNGGLLMGAVVTQHPNLMKAVVSLVGIYDMLRVELHPNGQFNITEFGTVKNKDQFEAMFAYSPYHNVKDGTAYPAVLFTTGQNDPRVDPMQSRKMTARMQAANGANTPILLRTSADTGHGGSTGLDESIALYADVAAFLLNQLGVVSD